MSKNDQNTPQAQPTPDPETRGNPVSVLSSGVNAVSHNPHLLRYLRETANLTQAALAKEIKVETETVIDWETGRRHPSQKHQRALEKCFRLPSGGLALEMKDILAQDFSAAYFGDPLARERLEWADKNLQLGQALRIIPILPKT